MIWGNLETVLYRWLRFNPAVALLELRTRLRGQRAFGMLFFFAFIGSVALVIAFMVVELPRSMGAGAPSLQGASVLMALMMVQLTLVLLILPAYGAAAIAAERERQTLELVEATMLSATDIVSGKLLAVGAFALMLLAANLPVAAWCMMLGGMNLRQIVYSYTYLGALSLMTLAYGLLISALSRRVMTAVVVSYALIVALYIGAPVVLTVLMAIISGYSHHSPTIGVAGSMLFLLLTSSLIAALLYLLLRSLVRRHGLQRSSILGICIPAAAAIALGAWLVTGASSMIGSTSHWGIEALYALHPYFVMVVFAHPDMASNVLSSGLKSGGLGADTAVWLVATVVALGLGALLWALAISAFRWKAQRS